MKYWHIVYDGERYKINMQDTCQIDTIACICVFTNFDMAYQYITVLNGNSVQNVYSRWTISKR
jgi:hypothetical protein